MTTAPPTRGAPAGDSLTLPPADGRGQTQRSRRARRARVLIALLALGLVWASASYLAGLLGAVVLDVTCAPAYRRLAPRLGPRLAAFLITVAATLLLVAPAVGLVVAALQQAPSALQRVAESSAVARLSELHVGPIDLGAQIERVGDTALAWVSSRAFDVAGSVTRALLNLMIALVGLYYLLPSAGTLWEEASPLIPFSRAGTEALRERFVSVTEATLLGIVATAVSQGLVVGLAFWMVGLPNPLVWGVVTGVTSILPILGASLVWLPGVAVLTAEGRYAAAVVLAVIGLVIASNIDNVVRPSVYRHVSGIHPMATLVGAFAGVELLGLVGLLLGPLAITYGVELLRLYRLEYGGE